MTETVPPHMENESPVPYSQDIPAPIAQDVADQRAGVQHCAPSDSTPLVLGILSIVFAGIVGLVLSIIGLITSGKALAETPDSGKAKGGRICSIIGLVLSIIATVALTAMLVLGVGFMGFITGEDDAVKQAAVTTLDEAFNPTPEKRAAAVASLDSAFETTTGISFFELGISSEEFASWLYDDASYEISHVSLDISESNQDATVTVSVATHSLSDLRVNIISLADDLDQNDYSDATTEADVYKIAGEVVKKAIEITPVSTKTLTLPVTKVDGIWQVNKDEAAKFIVAAFVS